MPPILIAFLGVVFAGVLLANVLASRRIIRDELGTSGQKVAQFLLVWLVPVAGAVCVFLLTRSSLGPGAGRYHVEREEPDEDVAVAKIDYSSSD